MHAYIHTYEYVSTHVSTHVYALVYVSMHMSIHISMRMSTYTCMCMPHVYGAYYLGSVTELSRRFDKWVLATKTDTEPCSFSSDLDDVSLTVFGGEAMLLFFSKILAGWYAGMLGRKWDVDCDAVEGLPSCNVG